jgi:hypothetical protein
MLIALLLALAPAGTTNGRWVSIGEDGNGATWWLDAKTAPPNRGSAEVWFKIVPNPSEHSSLVDTVTRIGIDCGRRKFATLATVKHYKDGRSVDDEMGSLYESAAPDTVGEWIVGLFCDKM